MTLRTMKLLMTGAGLLALPTGLARAAPAVVQDGVNLRSGPGTGYEVITAMPAGATVDVMGCQGGWCQVAFSGTTGFASRSYLGLAGPVASEPAYPASRDDLIGGGYTPGYSYGSGSYASGAGSYGYVDTSGDNAYRDNGYRDGTFRNDSARAEMRNTGVSENAAEIQGVNPMINAKSTTPSNARAEVRRRGTDTSAQVGANRSNPSATTGTGGEDSSPNFLGPKAKDNHY